MFQAKYYRHLCVNVISGLGFGLGKMESRGTIHQAPFVLTPNNKKMIHFFSYGDIRNQLTFDWFKLNVLCDEHPWICIKYPPHIFHHSNQTK